jgi:hypothetical protein
MNIANIIRGASAFFKNLSTCAQYGGKVLTQNAVDASTCSRL